MGLLVSGRWGWDPWGVFERFTERARQVVVLAQEEARGLTHNYIGTEHILLGLLREEQGLAARVLESFGITLESARERVVEVVGHGEGTPAQQIPFTAHAKHVLELSLTEGLSLGHYIGTEHILLGLLRESEGVASRILLKFDTAERIRNEVIQRLPEEALPLSSGFFEPRPVAPDPPAPGRFRQQPEGEPQQDCLVVQIELGITPPAAGFERLHQAAIDAVQRVYEGGGVDVHYIGIRSIDLVGEDHQGQPIPAGDGTAIPDPEQIEAFRAFRRPATRADETLPDDVVRSLRPELDPSLGRCVYSGREGKAFILPGPGSICFIAIGEAFGTVRGETTTALAADGGTGFVNSMRGRPVTCVGVLPAGGHHLQILDREGRASVVPLNADDGYWLEISDPVTLFLITPNGTKREIPLHDVNR